MWGLGFRDSRHREVSLLGSLCELKVRVFQSQLYKMGPILLKSCALGLTRGSPTGRHFDKPPKVGLL